MIEVDDYSELRTDVEIDFTSSFLHPETSLEKGRKVCMYMYLSRPGPKITKLLGLYFGPYLDVK